MKLKALEDSRPVAPVRETGIRRRYYTPDSEIDRAQLIAALDCSRDALLIVDCFGRVCAANAAAATLLGVDPQRLQQSYVQNHVAALDRGDGLLDGTISGPTTLDVSLPDGRRAQARLAPLANARAEATHACIAFEPIADGVAQAGLEVVGRLVAELAHDVNNQLSAALNYVFILRRRIGADPQLAPHLEELQATAWRAATLTSGLKLLGPKRSCEVERLDVAQVMQTLAPVLEHVASGYPLSLQLPPDLPPVNLPRAHLEQLLVMTTLSATARARARGAGVVRVTATCTQSARGNGRNLRVIWDGEPGEPSLYGLSAGLTKAGRAHGTLRRAFKRCGAVPGHDATRIWVDLAAAD